MVCVYFGVCFGVCVCFGLCLVRGCARVRVGVHVCARVFVTSQHGVLVLGSADQPADAIDHLALRVQLFLLGLLAEENHCGGRKVIMRYRLTEQQQTSLTQVSLLPAIWPLICTGNTLYGDYGRE